MTEPITGHGVDWSTVSTAQIAATLKALVPLVSPNRNMELIAEAAARLEGFAAQLAEAREEAARIVDQMAITQRAIGRPDDWPEDAWNARQVGIIDKLERAAEKIRALKGE